MENNSRGLFISVHIADIHFAAFDPKEQYEILHNQFIEKIKQFPRIDIISINGDLFDHKLMANSNGIFYASMFVDELVEIAREKNCTLLLLHGTYSHDADQLKLFLHYMNDSTVDVRIITQIQFEQVKNARILCIPELYGIDENIYQHYLHHDGWYDEAIIHGTFEGSVYGNNVGNGRLFTFDDFLHCRGFMVGGHVHKPGIISGYFYYCGNPYRWKFGEEEDKGFLICAHDLDTQRHYVHFEKIISHQYITMDLNQAVGRNPKEIIDYINDLKASQGIDFLKIRFKYPVEGADKVIINNYYRNKKDIFVEFLDLIEEQKAKAEANGEIDQTYSFIFNDQLSPFEKFVQYVNTKEGTQFITVDRLKQILESSI